MFNRKYIFKWLIFHWHASSSRRVHLWMLQTFTAFTIFWMYKQKAPKTTCQKLWDWKTMMYSTDQILSRQMIIFHQPGFSKNIGSLWQCSSRSVGLLDFEKHGSSFQGCQQAFLLFLCCSVFTLFFSPWFFQLARFSSRHIRD